MMMILRHAAARLTKATFLEFRGLGPHAAPMTAEQGCSESNLVSWHEGEI